MHALVGKGVAGIGAVMMLSALVVNPWVGVYYQDYIENYYNVMLGYVWWSLGMGLLLVVLGFYAGRRERERWTGVAMMVTVVAMILLADRFLLVIFGLSYWVPDPFLGYRHRPNAVRVQGSRLIPSIDNRLHGVRTRINRYGHHDDDFPMIKPRGELRGLMLGDSVTMGHGLDKDGTIAGLLEDILSGSGSSSYQIINTGVEGYSSNHEYAIFRESLVFEPDFVTVGLCLNDITDPAVFDTELGGIGRFSGVFHLSNALTGYLANETGFSRLIAWALTPMLTIEHRRLAQVYNVLEMVNSSPEDKRFKAGWKLVFENLQAIYQLAREQDIEVVLLIYPFTFQLFAEELQHPQRILLEHARRQGVDVIDLTRDYEEAIRADIEQVLREIGKVGELVQEDVDLLLAFQAKRYFMDEDHPTPIGNRLAAGRLAEYLHHKGLVDLDLPALRQEQHRVLQRDPGKFTFRMPHTPQDVASTAYILFLLEQDIEEIRRVFEIGLKATSEARTRSQLYRAWGEMERARGHEEVAMAAFRRAEIQ
ncbi:MAG: hypothetical protein HOL51_13810 [Gemmatimonadetes bacterium]|nr:hypothetical protein [Gemmatimonadota bacterium]MBT5327191.1 hypothetical protein [Gemmatimonadota bacterium]